MGTDHWAVLGFACFHCRLQKQCSSCGQRLLNGNSVSRFQPTQHTKCKWCNNFFLPLTDSTAPATREKRLAQIALVTAAALALLQTATPAPPPLAPLDVDQVPASSAASSSASPASPELDESDDDDDDDSSPPLAAAAAAPASSAAAASLSSPPPFSQSDSPLTSTTLDALACLLRYGYALVRATPETLALALLVATLQGQLPASAVATIIGGLVSQVDLAGVHGFKATRKTWKTSVCALGQRLGLPSQLRAVLPKLLTATTGNGGQAIHWDAIEGPAAPDRYSVILYCSAGAQSTAMPRFPLSAFTPDVTSPASMRQFAHLLDTDWFHSVPVFPGDMMIFSQRVPHYGTENPSLSPRIALFGLLSTSFARSQDKFQMFRWRYMEEAYGPQSLQFAHALVDDAAQRPLFRFDAAALISAYGCLVKHRLWGEYCDASPLGDQEELLRFATVF